MNVDKKDSEEKTIGDILREINPKFSDWLNEILKLDVSRSLEINTYLVNFYIALNYFPSFYLLIEWFSKRADHNTYPGRLRNFIKIQEKIHSIFIMLPMNYNYPNPFDMSTTDRQIDKLKRETNLVKNFFLYNPNPPSTKVKDFDTILKDYLVMEWYLPNLMFDPDYQQLMLSEPIVHLFLSNPVNLLNPSNNNFPETKYLPTRSIFFKSMKIRDSYPQKKLFEIDSTLEISKFMVESMNYFGIYDFNSTELIDDLIPLFTNYYVKKMPSRTPEIRCFLLCFGELLKLSKGLLYVVIRYKKLLKVLQSKVPKQKAQHFLDIFCLNRTNFNISEFSAEKFMQKYRKFLRYSCYNNSGKVYTGAYLIWRALMYYLISLQKGEKFRTERKGPILEKWAHDVAKTFDLKPKKIILINTKQQPTPRYHDMKKKFKSIESIEIEVEFPPRNELYFHDIDLALRIDKYMFVFEVKGTRHSIVEEVRYVDWAKAFDRRFRDLQMKTMILKVNLKKNQITHPFLKGVEEFIPQIVKTEGSIAKRGVMSTITYIKYLKSIREHLNKGTIEEFLDSERFESELFKV